MKKLFTLMLMAACGMTAWAQTVVTDATGLKNAIANGGDIKLDADITLSSVVTVSENVVLDLNEHKLTLEKTRGLTVQGGSLELTGKGTISSTRNNPFYVVGSQTDQADYSTLKVGSNVTVSTTNTNAIGIYPEDQTDKTIKTKAYGVNVEVNGTLVSSSYNVYVSSTIIQTEGNVPVLKFDGATIKGIDLEGYAKTTLDNTTVTLPSNSNITYAVNIQAGEFTMNSGKVSAPSNMYGIYLSQKSSDVPATVTITGGTVDAGVPLTLMSVDGTIAVSGGLFSKAVSSQYCAAGYKATTAPDASGYYTVEAVTKELTIYAGASEGKTQTITLAEWQNILKTTPNAVAIMDYSAENKAFAESTQNIILKSQSGATTTPSYNCPNFVLTDLSNWGDKNANTAAATDFYCPVDFRASAGSYSRILRGDYNSACVPFAIPEGTFSSKELLAYTSYSPDDNNAMFTYQNAASAGVAVIINPTTETEWTMQFDNTKILGSPVKGTAFTGVFQTTEAYQGMYSVNTSLVKKFSPLENNLYPFRSCFSLSGDVPNGSNAKPSFINFTIVDETTGINEVQSTSATTSASEAYNLAGQKVNANAKGIVIINGKKVIR